MLYLARELLPNSRLPHGSLTVAPQFPCWISCASRRWTSYCADGEARRSYFSHFPSSRELAWFTFQNYASFLALQYFTLSGLSTDLGLLNDGSPYYGIRLLFPCI